MQGMFTELPSILIMFSGAGHGQPLGRAPRTCWVWALRLSHPDTRSVCRATRGGLDPGDLGSLLDAGVGVDS